MKKMNLSLIVKIAGTVFIAFAVILGNEIRLGINRYIKNTLETDASATVRNLDKFAKEYSDMTIFDSYSLNSEEFQSLYSSALSGDSSMVKSLVTTKGGILDISRETLEDALLCMLVSDFKDAENWPKNGAAYFHLKSIGNENLEKLETVLNDEKAVRTATLSIVFPEGTDFSNNEFRNIKVDKIMVDDELVIDCHLSGKKTTISGQMYFYSSQYKEVFFGNNSESVTYGYVTHSITDNEQTIVIDYHDAMRGIKKQLQKNFNKFVDTSKPFVSTNYTDYYLLAPYKYNGRYYSSVAMKIIDWVQLNRYYSEYEFSDLSEEEKLQKATLGYVIVTKEYTHLTSNALKQFIIDNSSTYLIALLLIALLCLFVVYILVKPIHRLETIAKHIARKEFDYPINVNRHDELGNLARSIDTMSKELERTINDLYFQIEKVQSLETIRKEFVANFTHEIKTPLGIINGFSELVEIEQDEKKRNEYIDIIQGETKKINTLVLAMLEYSKLESDKITLNIEDIDLLELVDESIDSMMYLFKKKNISIETSLESVIVEADRFKIQMVISNFISNALRYTDDNQKISICLNENMFSIENEGAYIPQEDIEKIWLTFHKVDKSRNQDGTGLGLAICKSVLELHHFPYGVENTEKGVKFYFCFEGKRNDSITEEIILQGEG